MKTCGKLYALSTRSILYSEYVVVNKRISQKYFFADYCLSSIVTQGAHCSEEKLKTAIEKLQGRMSTNKRMHFISEVACSLRTRLRSSHPRLKKQTLPLMNMIWWILSHSLWSFSANTFPLSVKLYFSFFSFCENSQKKFGFIENYETVKKSQTHFHMWILMWKEFSLKFSLMQENLDYEVKLASSSWSRSITCIEMTIIIAPCHHSNPVFELKMYEAL